MTQAQPSRSTLPLTLVPHPIAQTEDWTDRSLGMTIAQPSLRLVPGQIGELNIQIENLAQQQTVQWHLTVSGNFAPAWLEDDDTACLAFWCKLYQQMQQDQPEALDWWWWCFIYYLLFKRTANRVYAKEISSFQPKKIFKVIRPGERVEKKVTFRVPPDFFEQQTALSQEQPSLQLDYEADVAVYAALYEPLLWLWFKTYWSMVASFGIHNHATNQWLIGLTYFVAAPRQIVLADFRTVRLQVRSHDTYMAFLPTIYRASDFVSRLLASIEQTFDPTVQTIDAFWAYLDPLTTPTALLPFLAHWVAWPLDSRWTVAQQRRLLRHAVTLYRWRGTRYGLRLYLHLYTGLPLEDDSVSEHLQHISVVENHQPGFIMGTAQFAQQPMLGGGRPFHFTVTLRSDRAEDLDEVLVRDLIEQVKPAHCTYDLMIQAAVETPSHLEPALQFPQN